MTIALEQFRNKKVAVIGLGKAGMAAYRALTEGGAKALGWDDNPKIRQYCQKQNMYLCDLHDDRQWRDIDALIVSPGIPKNNHVLSQARLHDIPLYGEIDLLQSAYPECHYIGVTGTNGKSTVTSLIGHILISVGKKCQTGGNLGKPALDFNPPEPESFCVLEMSSFQLSLSRNLRFNISILLNISPDHLDYHGSMKAYIESKLHIFTHMQDNDTAIISLEDPICRSCAQVLQKKNIDIISFGFGPMEVKGVYVEDGILIDSLGEKPQQILKLDKIPALSGLHNAQNIAAAYAACHLYGVTPEQFCDAATSFPGLAHRQQEAKSYAGLRFINDSKATNPISVAYALTAYDGDIYWIAGGREKESVSLEPLRRVCEQLKLSHAFFIGEAAESFQKLFNPYVNTTMSKTIDVAFQQATAMALQSKKQNAVILFSPACASYDQFNNFEERGNAFMMLVEDFRKAEKQRHE